MPRSAILEELISHWEPRLQQAFLDAIYKARGGAHVDQIVRMIERGDIDNAIRAAGLNPTAFRPFDLALAQAFEAGGEATAVAIPAIIAADGLRTIFQFAIRNPAAEDWLANHSSNAIVQILSDQRDMIRAVLADAMTKGLNPRTVALDIVGRINPLTGRREGGLIGLTRSQAQWVLNYEQELRNNPAAAFDRLLRDKRFDPIVRRAIDSGNPIPGASIDNMVRTYRNRALRMRAEAIGRTEAMQALHGAQEQSVNQAIESGINRKDVRFTWRTSRDKRVRDLHRPMDGETVAYGEPFLDGNGNQLRYPGDPAAPAETTINCRCWREVRIDFLSNIE
jgi:Phage Mu protein F like protein